MNPIDSKLKKILAMIDGATSEGEARAASLALQRLLAANNMTIDDIDLNDNAPEVNESAEDLGKRVPEWVKVLAYVIAKNYRCRYYMQTSHGAYDYWSGRRNVTGTRFVFVGESQDATVAAGCFRATSSRSRRVSGSSATNVSSRMEPRLGAVRVSRTAIASVSFRGSRTPTASSSSRTRPWPWRLWCPRASAATWMPN